MIRPFTLLCLILAAGSGLYLYSSKHRAQLEDREVARLVHEASDIRAHAALLHAEYDHLSDPDRLHELSDQILHLQPTDPKQYAGLADLDKRLPAVAPLPKLPEPVMKPAPVEAATPVAPDAPAAPDAGPTISDQIASLMALKSGAAAAADKKVERPVEHVAAKPVVPAAVVSSPPASPPAMASRPVVVAEKAAPNPVTRPVAPRPAPVAAPPAALAQAAVTHYAAPAVPPASAPSSAPVSAPVSAAPFSGSALGMARMRAATPARYTPQVAP